MSKLPLRKMTVANQPRVIAGPWLDIGAVVKRTGLTERALRFYEARGLLSPLRRPNGRRSYGAGELARIEAIVVLKNAGLSLAQIGETISGGKVDLTQILSLQREALARRRRSVERSLATIDRAIALAKAGRRIDVDTLCHLIRSVTMDTKKTSDYQPLIDRYFSPVQKDALAQRSWTAADQADIEKEWADVFATAARLMKAKVAPTSPEALALAERSMKLVAAFTQGDAGLTHSLNTMYGDWVGGAAKTTDGSTPPALPFGDPALWSYLGDAQAALRKTRGA
jgi:DNA-binding transcriptional MerR regulator